MIKPEIGEQKYVAETKLCAKWWNVKYIPASHEKGNKIADILLGQ